MIRAILVEDQELIRKSLGIVLESISDIKVIGYAENGQEAIRLCEEALPEVILMDIQMPIMDGVQATKIIKERWPEVKVIILTTFQDITNVRNALNAGAEGYILKAVDPEFLVKGIELVYHGGSLIPQQLAKEVYLSLSDRNDQLVQSNSESHVTNHNPYNLLESEIQVLSYLAQGLQNRDIAEMMFLSVGTVKNYVSIIYSKLNVKNRSAAIMKAVEESLIPVKKNKSKS
ncbi:response regulator transcription factor [Bacillus sp. OK048]|uniref:response regulator transcription factor n=1 Tax=Bacillus sp. OK048 TaxID=1882761 RepID=UPI000889D45F|nr:response regulator transcription factor [Bacillus sp. OK048]SDM85712.1 two component transcriptional regulator, LuxR family [Bacillus sp. OK048]